MRTRAVLTSIFASAGVLVVGWQLGAATAAQNTAATTLTTTKTAGAPNAPAAVGATATPSATARASAPAAAPVPAKSSDGTYTGATARTRFGNMQVQVTIAGGKITAVTPLQLTGPDRRSVQISNQAAPLLLQEVLAAQSANVSNISGATYTTAGYLQSLQSALSQAGF